MGPVQWRHLQVALVSRVTKLTWSNLIQGKTYICTWAKSWFYKWRLPPWNGPLLSLSEYFVRDGKAEQSSIQAGVKCGILSGEWIRCKTKPTFHYNDALVVWRLRANRNEAALLRQRPTHQIKNCDLFEASPDSIGLQNWWCWFQCRW